MKYTWKYTMHQYTFNQLNLIKINLKSRIFSTYADEYFILNPSPLSDSDDKAEYRIYEIEATTTTKKRTNILFLFRIVYLLVWK